MYDYIYICIVCMSGLTIHVWMYVCMDGWMMDGWMHMCVYVCMYVCMYV